MPLTNQPSSDGRVRGTTPPHAGLTGHPPQVEVDLEPLIRQIDEIGLALDADGTHEVILYNDEHHFFEDVVEVIRFATGYPLHKARAITVRVDSEGQAVAYEGALPECRRVAAIFAKVQLQHEIR